MRKGEDVFSGRVSRKIKFERAAGILEWWVTGSSCGCIPKMGFNKAPAVAMIYDGFMFGLGIEWYDRVPNIRVG